MDASRKGAEYPTSGYDKEGTGCGQCSAQSERIAAASDQPQQPDASDEARVLYRATDPGSADISRQAEAPYPSQVVLPEQDQGLRGSARESRTEAKTGPAYVWVLYQGRACRFRVTSNLTAGQLLDEAQRVLVGATPLVEGATTGVGFDSCWCLADAQGALVPRACPLVSSGGGDHRKQRGRAEEQAPSDGIFSEETLRNAESFATSGRATHPNNAQSAMLTLPSDVAPWLWPIFHLVHCPAVGQRRRHLPERAARLAARLVPGVPESTAIPGMMTGSAGTGPTAADVLHLSTTQRLRNTAIQNLAGDPGFPPMDDSSTETEEDTESEGGPSGQRRDHNDRLTVPTPSGSSRSPGNPLGLAGRSSAGPNRSTGQPLDGREPPRACAVCGDISRDTHSCAMPGCGRAFHPSCMGAFHDAETPFVCDQHGCAACGNRISGQTYLCKSCLRMFCTHHIPHGSRREPVDLRAAPDGGFRVGLVTCALCAHQQLNSGDQRRLWLVPPAPVAPGVSVMSAPLPDVPLLWTTPQDKRNRRNGKPLKRDAGSMTKQPRMPPAEPLRPEDEEAGPLLTMTMLDDGKRYILGARTRGLTGYDEAAGLCNNRFLQAAFLVLREAEWTRRKRLAELAEAAAKAKGVSEQERNKCNRAAAAIPTRVEMDAREILRVARARGFNPTVSPEPHNTFSSQIYRNMKRRREASTFRKADRGKFTLAPWVLEELNPHLPSVPRVCSNNATEEVISALDDAQAELLATAENAHETSSASRASAQENHQDEPSPRLTEVTDNRGDQQLGAVLDSAA